MQVVGESYRVHPQPENLHVFCLFEAELAQVHLVAEATFGGHRGHERLEVLGDGFLAGDELRAQARHAALFVRGEVLPVFGVSAEVDVCRVPELGVALVEQP